MMSASASGSPVRGMSLFVDLNNTTVTRSVQFDNFAYPLISIVERILTASLPINRLEFLTINLFSVTTDFELIIIFIYYANWQQTQHTQPIKQHRKSTETQSLKTG